MLKTGVNINLQGHSNGDTPLHIAVIGESDTYLKFLLNNGARIHIKNKAGKSPLDIAREFSSKPTVQLLEKYRR